MTSRLRPLERVEAALASVVLALAVIGATLLPLTSAPFVRTLVSLVHSAEITGISEQATFDAAEAVRRFVLHADAPRLPATIEGQAAFDQSAVSHLVDVRNVLIPARTVALAAVLAATAWVVARRHKKRLLAVGLGTAGWVLAVSLGALGFSAISDFDAFFSWFHGLFFAPGTWMFPADALLIRVFPLPFWTSAAAIWGALVLVALGLLFSFAHRLCFTRTADSV